jgi:oxidase EvaA
VWNLIELGPTVQSLPGAPMEEHQPFMFDEVVGGTAGLTRHRSTQCEEGGRFYQYATENIVVELDPGEERPVPANYTWATLGQLNALIRYGNHLNIEARSVLACLDVQPA